MVVIVFHSFAGELWGFNVQEPNFPLRKSQWFLYKQLDDVTQKLVSRKHFVSLCCNKCQRSCNALRINPAALDYTHIHKQMYLQYIIIL